MLKFTFHCNSSVSDSRKIPKYSRVLYSAQYLKENFKIHFNNKHLNTIKDLISLKFEKSLSNFQQNTYLFIYFVGRFKELFIGFFLKKY